MNLNPNAGELSLRLIRIFSESAASSAEPYLAMAKETNQVIVGGVDDGTSIYVTVAHGSESYYRQKHDLTSWELENGYKPGKVSPEIVSMGGLKILPLICYEICYPVYWPQFEPINYVVHIIGFPMFDKHQWAGWHGLQMVASRLYQCPVVCACGKGEGIDPTGLRMSLQIDCEEKELCCESEK